MAIATGTAIALGISAAAAGVQTASGISRKRKAQKALANFKRQELQNVTKDMRVSTLGAELQAREQARRFSTSVDALRSGGVRGVVGGLGRQEQIQQFGTQRIAADLDRQQTQIDRMRAQDEARIRSMQEQRESGAIRGLGMEIASGDAQMQQGIMGLAKTAASAATFIPGTIGGGGAVDAAGGAVKAVNTGDKLSQGLANTSSNFIPSAGGGPGVVDVSAAFSGLGQQGTNALMSSQNTFGLMSGGGFAKGLTGSVDVGQHEILGGIDSNSLRAQGY